MEIVYPGLAACVLAWLAFLAWRGERARAAERAGWERERAAWAVERGELLTRIQAPELVRVTGAPSPGPPVRHVPLHDDAMMEEVLRRG